VEAALTKLGCLLGRGLPPDVVRHKMGTVSRGERTMIVEHKRFSLHDKYVSVAEGHWWPWLHTWRGFGWCAVRSGGGRWLGAALGLYGRWGGRSCEARATP
jgi:hypothetical protein